MTKFTLLTFRESKAALLKDLQKFGDVHFRDMSRDDLEGLEFLRQEHTQSDIQRYESELDRVSFALSKLERYTEKPGFGAKRPTYTHDAFDNFLDNYDYGAVCAFVKDQDDRIAAVKSEIARLKSENEGLSVWEKLDVAPSVLDAFTAARYLLGTVNKMAADALRAELEAAFSEVYIEFLGSQKDDMAVLILTDGAVYEDLFTKAKDIGFSRANITFSDVPKRIVAQNNRRITELERESEKAAGEIEGKSGEYKNLLVVKDCIATILEREKAAQNFMGSDTVVFIEGWVPEEDNTRFMEILARACGEDFYIEQTAVEAESADVPIKLKNNRVVSAFESITSMYSMPRYNEFDPTPLLAPFYWLFFGLMVGDMGYGLILMAGTAIAMKALDLKEGMKNFMRFFFYLSFAVIVGGALYGSLFGFAVFTPLPVLDANGVQLVVDGIPQTKALLDSNLDIVTMIILSIGIGVVHVLFGVAVKGALCIKRGDIAGAIFDSLFWIIAVLSGIGLIVGAMTTMLPAGIFQVCKWAFIISLVGLACTQGRSSPSIGGKIGNGLYGVYGITSYVGDLVSYTRIVALALSGAYIAFSFNLMASILPAGFARIVFGFIIMVLGQALNLALSLLSAYVHTCRLQYVEYFGKFYEGGGVPFKPLKLKHDSIHIKN
jgi:V/A-type H+-transporting ATPase subunit I